MIDVANAQNLDQALGQLSDGLGSPLGAMASGFSVANLIGNLIFSGIGFVAFIYGKKNAEYTIMVIGLILMAYPYFITNTIWMYVIGIALTAVIYYLRMR